MHLLVLSAFRHGAQHGHVGRHCVSMHLLVLSAFRREAEDADRVASDASQCTFWCSVLSDSFETTSNNASLGCLNAPFGAQCFPTAEMSAPREHLLHESQCTFWCSVLSDGRNSYHESVDFWSQCTFWCSVLSDGPTPVWSLATRTSQCTFWCSVLSDRKERLRHTFCFTSLNAPFGAQCFPT